MLLINKIITMKNTKTQIEQIIDIGIPTGFRLQFRTQDIDGTWSDLCDLGIIQTKTMRLLLTKDNEMVDSIRQHKVKEKK